jgi:hypothetical protein
MTKKIKGADKQTFHMTIFTQSTTFLPPLTGEERKEGKI